MAMNHDDAWNDICESETIEELPRLSIGSNDGNISASRRVSFPKSDSALVTGYLEPANPWESVYEVKNIDELKNLYEESCRKHNTEPLTTILDHLKTLELNKSERQQCLTLKNVTLTPESCEALEEIFKRVQYELIDLSSCNLNDVAGSALFDMIEYYEAANELDISDNPGLTSRGWQSCISMIRKSRALQILTARGIVLSEINAGNLGKSLNQSCLHTIKLEHCGLTGRPLAALCTNLRKNSNLRELWIAHNDLSDFDAEKIAELLKFNPYLEFLDISNNSIKDAGLKRIVIALIEQSTNLQTPKDDSNEFSSISNIDNNNFENISSIISKNDNNKTQIDNNDIQQKNDDNLTCVSQQSSVTKNLNNTGRSMLDTLLNMNQIKESNKNSEINIIIDKIDENDKNDNNENNEIKNETKNEEILINNELNSRLDCIIENQINNEINVGIQDDTSSTISGSLTPTPPFNVDSSFSDEKCNENDFLLRKEDKHNNENECFKTNNNLLSFNKNDNNKDNLSTIATVMTPTPVPVPPPPPPLPLPPAQSTPLAPVTSNNNSLDVNENNNKMIEESDSISYDSAFESASEGDSKLLVKNFHKIDNYALTSPLSPMQSSSLPSVMRSHLHDQNEKQEQPLQRQQEQQQEQFEPESKSKSYDTKENNILINNESPLSTSSGIISSEIRNRSLSSDSLSSDNSCDLSSDTSQMISSKINEKLTKNDTLTRQKHNDEYQISNKKPRGLQALILWNNDITRESGEYISDLLDSTKSLELLNIGKNILSNDFLKRIKNSLQRNTTVSNLGLQSTHLNSEGIKILAEILQFGGNNTLQRVDIRDNNIQVEGLAALADALKSNNSITRIDIDDVPKRIPEDGNETQFHYSRMLHTVRSLCSKNEGSQETPSATATACNVKVSRHMSSRKISLTCQSLRTPLPDVIVKNELGLSDTIRKRSGTRLRSPLPSPPTISPSSSPVPSPSRNRFQVFRVIEKSPTQLEEMKESVPLPPPPPPPLPVKQIPTTRFSRFRVTMVECSPIKTIEKSEKSNKCDENKSNIEQKHKENSNEQITEKLDKNLNSDDTISKKMQNLQINMSTKISPIPEMCNVQIQTNEEIIDEKLIKKTNNENDILVESKENNNLNDNQNPVKETVQNEIENNKDIENIDKDLPVDQAEKNKQIDEIDHESNVTQSPLKETSNISTLSDVKYENQKQQPETTEGRTRRVSWISSGNYPATVDKLLNLFQHPGNLFSRSVSPENDKKFDNDNEISSSQSLIPLRKQSPPSLFQWHKTQTGEIKRISSDNMISSNLQSYVRGIADFGKQVFKQNVPFMDTISVSDTQQQQQDCKLIPSDIKMEIKENISPEHTVTKNSIVSFQSVSPAQEMIDTLSTKQQQQQQQQIEQINENEECNKNEILLQETTSATTTIESSYSVNKQQQQQQQQQQTPKIGDINDKQ